jgi:hypothetical protein
MAFSAIITLTGTVGTDAGPFNLYSDIDTYTAPFETGVSRADLISGYTSNAVTTGTTIVRVKSTGSCTNYIDIDVTEVHTSSLTNYGTRNVSGVMQKNGVTFTTFSVTASGGSSLVSLSGTTFNSTDSLSVIVSSTSPYGANITVDNGTIAPNGGILISPSNYNNQGTTSVTLVFNGTGGGWGVNPMTWFNMTFRAN